MLASGPGRSVNKHTSLSVRSTFPPTGVIRTPSHMCCRRPPSPDALGVVRNLPAGAALDPVVALAKAGP
jgi:hypothetical protein